MYGNEINLPESLVAIASLTFFAFKFSRASALIVNFSNFCKLGADWSDDDFVFMKKTMRAQI